MKVSFSTGDAGLTRSVFSREGRFLDVIVTRELLYLVSAKREMFVYKSFRVSTMSDFTDPVWFRIERKEFLNLMGDGIVTFFVSGESTVEVTFGLNSGLSFTMTRQFQLSDKSLVENFFKMFADRERFVPLKLSNLSPFLSLFRSSNGVIEVEEGIARVKTKNIRVYVRTICENINIFSDTLYLLLSNADTFYKYQNYIIGEGKDVGVVAVQDRKGEDADFDWIMNRKASQMINADFTSLCLLAKKCSGETDVQVDFDSGKAYFESSEENSKLSYSTSFSVKESKIRESKIDLDDPDSLDNLDLTAVTVLDTRVLPKLRFPLHVFKDLLSSVNRARVWVVVKKDFVVLDVEDKVFMVMGRGDYASSSGS